MAVAEGRGRTTVRSTEDRKANLEELCARTGARVAILGSLRNDDIALEEVFRTQASSRIFQHEVEAPDVLRLVGALFHERQIGQTARITLRRGEGLHDLPEGCETLLATSMGTERIAGSHTEILATLYDRDLDGGALLLHEIQEAYGCVIRLSAELRTRDKALDQTESQMASLLAISPDAIIATDDNDRIILFNKGAEAIFDYTANEILGHSINLLVPERLREAHSNHMSEFGKAPESSRLMGLRNRDIIGRRKDGTEFPAEASITKQTDQRGPNATVVLRDVTARRRSEQALFHAQRIRLLGNVTAGVAHDFNNLLTVIRGSLELAELEDPPADIREHIDVAHRQVDRGADLIARLLDLSRTDHDTETVPVIDPGSTLLLMSDMMRVLAGDLIKVNVHVHQSGPVEIDEQQLERAIINLVVNARDAIESVGEISVTCSTAKVYHLTELVELELRRGHYVLIEVTDTGSGMDNETIKCAFEPFFSTKRATGGTGLGLSMVYSSIKRAGGGLRIRSGTDTGTTIQLYLPMTELNGQSTSTTR